MHVWDLCLQLMEHCKCLYFIHSQQEIYFQSAKAIKLSIKNSRNYAILFAQKIISGFKISC